MVLSVEQAERLQRIRGSGGAELDASIQRVRAAVDAGLEHAVQLGTYVREAELVDEVLDLMAKFEEFSGPLTESEMAAAVCAGLSNRCRGRRLRRQKAGVVDTPSLSRALEWLAEDRERALGLLQRDPRWVAEYRVAAEIHGMVELDLLLERLVRVPA